MLRVDWWGLKSLLEPFRADVERQIEEYEARVRSEAPSTNDAAEPEPVGVSHTHEEERDEARVQDPASEPVAPAAEASTAQVDKEAPHEPAEEIPLTLSKKNPAVVLKTLYLTREHWAWLKKRAEERGCGISELVHRALAEYREQHG